LLLGTGTESLAITDVNSVYTHDPVIGEILATKYQIGAWLPETASTTLCWTPITIKRLVRRIIVQSYW